MRQAICVMAAPILLAMSGIAGAQSNPCRSIASDTERLACYDAAVRDMPVSPPPAATPKNQSAWQIVSTRDRLSNKVDNHAEAKATTEFTQRGESVSARLVVYCSRLLKGEPGRLNAHVWFSRPVTGAALGRTWGRVKIDDRPVHAFEGISGSRRQTIQVVFKPFNFAAGHGRDDEVAPLFSSKRIRVEYDLPIAGKTILEFATGGAKEAFSKLTCPDPEL